MTPPHRILSGIVLFLAAAAPSFAAPAQPGQPTIALPAPTGDAVVIHVSSSAGVDGQDGRSPETSVRSIRRGQALIRDGHGDRLLLKCGDTFDEPLGNWNKSGATPDEPMVIGSYGDGPRPRITAQQTILNLYGNQPLLHDLTISGLHFSAPGRDPDAPDFNPAAPAIGAVRVVRPVHRLTIQDCRVDHFNDNLVLTGDDKKGRLQEVVVRRCVVLDAWSTSGAHAGQGLYADKVDGLIVEDCVFDHNGWNEKVPGAVPNIFRHDIYISHDTSDVRVRHNVIARGASHGLQMRAGGVCEGNLFIDNAIHAILAGDNAVFRGNVVVGGRDIDEKTPRGFGVTVAAGKSLVADNLFLHKPTTSGGAITVEVGKWSPPEGVNAEICDNVVYEWNGNGLEVTGAAKSVSFHDNDLQRIANGRKVVTIKKPVDSCTFANNRYHADDERREKWFSLPEGFVAPADWGQKMRDASRVEQARYADASRTLPADFLAGARDERDGFTAPAAIAKLREAFNKPADSPGARGASRGTPRPPRAAAASSAR